MGRHRLTLNSLSVSCTTISMMCLPSVPHCVHRLISRFSAKLMSRGIGPVLKKIDHIGIVVADLASARDFFLALGFTVVRGGPLQGEWTRKGVLHCALIHDHISFGTSRTFGMGGRRP